MSENLPAVQNENVFQLMDKLDDDLIVAEIENRIVNTWVYTFPAKDGSGEMTGLSKVGVDAACTEMAKQGHIIREDEIKVLQDPSDSEYFLFHAKAARHLVTDKNDLCLETVIGTKRQWSKMKKRDGSLITDPFWYEKGATKALRNARSRMIPEEVKAKIISLAKELKRTRNIKPEEVQPEKQSSSNDTITDAQSKKLFAMMKEAGLPDDFRTWLKMKYKENTVQKGEHQVFTKAIVTTIFDKWTDLVAEFKNTMIACPEGADVPKTKCESCQSKPGCPSWEK